MVQSLKIPDPPITDNSQLNDWLRWLVKTLQQDFPCTQPYQFQKINILEDHSGFDMFVIGSGSGDPMTRYVMELDGSVIGITITSNEARTAGTITVDATINGTATGLQAVLDGTNIQYHYATQLPETDTFSAGDRLGVDLTSVGWTPTSADIVVTVIVLK